jgi:hypothetical protein
MFRASVLALALVFSAPALWRACVDQNVPLDTALVRFLLAVPVAAVLVGGVRIAMRRTDREV